MKEKEIDHSAGSEKHDEAHPLLSRRRFFRAAGLTAAGLIAARCGKSQNPLDAGNSLSLLDKRIQLPGNGQIVGSDDFLARVATASIDTYDPATLKATIQASIEALGGFGDLVKSGDTVGFKLNMTGGQSPARKTPNDYGLNAVELFWSHPEILRAVMELFRDAGAGRLIVVEANYDEASYTDWGYKDVVDYLGAEYYNLNNKAPYNDFREVPVINPLTHWESYFHNGVLYDLDCFVSLPKTKRHLGGGITNAMKNMIGSVPLSKYQDKGAWREKLHSNDNLEFSNSYEGLKNLVRTIVDLNKIRPTHLAICDAILTANYGEGPWIDGFEPAAFNTLITSKDPVAADAIATTLFGFDPMSSDKEGAFSPTSMHTSFAGTDNYLRIAAEQGLGVCDPTLIEVIDVTVSTAVEMEG